MTTMTMKLGSLFDGSGTAPLAAAMLGWEPVWASEIEPYPVKVTSARFPLMKHLGDITQIDGGQIEPVDVIVGGSPCQDLSVAGKQAGIENGTRSNLFYEMTRIIREMRSATNGKYPRFVVWENVPGAFSSNKGRDFHAVVQAFCALADDAVHIPEPEADRKTGRLTWKNAGTVVGDGWSFAWRVLDAQYWGVPQRRRRIFAVLDFGSERAGEVLFERTRLPWNTEPGTEARQGAAADAVGRADRGGGVGAFCAGAAPAAGSIGYSEQVAPTLKAAQCAFPMGAVVYPVGAVGSLCARADSSPCIDRGQPFVAMFSGGQVDKAGGIGYSEDASPTLKSTSSGGNTVPTVVYEPKSAMDENWAESDAKNALRANASKSAHVVVQDAVYALQGNGIDRALTAGCNGAGWREGEMYTLNTIDRPAVAYGVDCRNGALNDDLSPTMQAKSSGGQSLNCMPLVLYTQERIGQYQEGRSACTQLARQHKSATDLVVHKARRYIVRRLTPNECARLQGFPDWWTDGVKGSDSAKYKMWGNGMALPCMVYVLGGLGQVSIWDEMEEDGRVEDE